MLQVATDRQPSEAQGAPQGAQGLIDQIRDPRLRRAALLMARGDIDLLSLDVFDTVIWRAVPKPTDLFFVLGERLVCGGHVSPGVTAMSFHDIRIRAENLARVREYQNSGSGEVTLEEIYREIPEALMRDGNHRRLMDLEVECERDFIEADSDTALLIEAAEALEIPYVFVSDTYFTESQVRQLVDADKNRGRLKPQQIFVSSEHRTSKPLGLFDIMLANTSVPASKVLHIGDNEQADVEPPRARGLQAIHYDTLPDEPETIFGRELGANSHQRWPMLHSEEGDWGLTALRRRSAYRDTPELDVNPIFRAYGARMLGPVFTGFASWIAERAKEEGAETLLCQMREGRLFKALIDQVSGKSIETKEAFVSRFATITAAIKEVSVEELGPFILRPSHVSIAQIAPQLGLTATDFAEFTDDPEALLTTTESKGALIDFIAARTALRSKVLRYCREQRRGLIAHLFGDADPKKIKKIYLVDLGYNATIQGSIQRVLDAEGLNIQTHGFYLATAPGALATQEHGGICEGYLVAHGEPASLSFSLQRSPEVVEQSTMAACGSTLSYEADGTPILDELMIPEKQGREIAAVQQGVQDFCESWTSNPRLTPDLASSEQFRAWLRKILVRSIVYPTDEEVSYLGAWQHDENFGAAKMRTIVDTDEIAERAPYLAMDQWADVRMQDIHWLFGGVQKLMPQMAEPIWEAFQFNVPGRVLHAAIAPERAALFFNFGQGFLNTTPVMKEYRPNLSGNAEVSFSVQLGDEPLLALAMRFANPGMLVRMDQVDIRFEPTEGEAILLSLRGEEGLSQLEFTGMKHLHGCLYQVESDSSVIGWVAPTAISLPGGALRVTARFGLMENLENK